MLSSVFFIIFNRILTISKFLFRIERDNFAKMKYFQIFISFLVLFYSVEISAQRSYNSLIHEGNRDFNQKNYESSSTNYLKAAELNQKDFTAHYNLGNALYKRKMYDEAKAEYEKAQKLAVNKPDKVASLYNMANSYMQTKNLDKAAELYKKSLKLDPTNESIRKNYEIAKLKQKQQQQNQKNADKNNQKEGENQQQNQNQNQQGEQPKQNAQPGGNSQQQQGNGENGNQPNQNNQEKNGNNLPKDLEKAIMNRVEDKEKETARRILNKNGYSIPESNEKDW